MNPTKRMRFTKKQYWIFGIIVAIIAWPIFIANISKTEIKKEYVTLNTGEVLEIERVKKYTCRGTVVNPYICHEFIHSNTGFKFKYKKIKYEFNTKGIALVLAISPQDNPVFINIMEPRNYIYMKNHPLCTNPNYDQWVFDSISNYWIKLNYIEKWTYELKSNLLFDAREDYQKKISTSHLNVQC
jgi:hypothetical protein